MLAAASGPLRAHTWRGWLGAGVVGTSLLLAAAMRAHQGGFLNVLMPAHWGVALALGVAAAHWRATHPGWQGTGVAAAVLFAQLGWQLHGLGALGGAGEERDLARLLPTPRDREAGDALVEALRGYPGPVLSPYAPWLAVRAGFEPSFHLYAFWDVAQFPGGPLRRQALSSRGRARSATACPAREVPTASTAWSSRPPTRCSPRPAGRHGPSPSSCRTAELRSAPPRCALPPVACL